MQDISSQIKNLSPQDRRAFKEALRLEIERRKQKEVDDMSQTEGALRGAAGVVKAGVAGAMGAIPDTLSFVGELGKDAASYAAEGVGYLADQVGLEGTGRALKGVSEGLDSVDIQTDTIGYIDRGIDDVTGGYTEPFNEETRALQEGVQLGASFVGGGPLVQGAKVLSTAGKVGNTASKVAERTGRFVGTVGDKRNVGMAVGAGAGYGGADYIAPDSDFTKIAGALGGSVLGGKFLGKTVNNVPEVATKPKSMIDEIGGYDEVGGVARLRGEATGNTTDALNAIRLSNTGALEKFTKTREGKIEDNILNIIGSKSALPNVEQSTIDLANVVSNDYKNLKTNVENTYKQADNVASRTAVDDNDLQRLFAPIDEKSPFNEFQETLASKGVTEGTINQMSAFVRRQLNTQKKLAGSQGRPLMAKDIETVRQNISKKYRQIVSTGTLEQVDQKDGFGAVLEYMDNAMPELSVYKDARGQYRDFINSFNAGKTDLLKFSTTDGLEEAGRVFQGEGLAKKLLSRNTMSDEKRNIIDILSKLSPESKQATINGLLGDMFQKSYKASRGGDNLNLSTLGTQITNFLENPETSKKLFDKKQIVQLKRLGMSLKKIGEIYQNKPTAVAGGTRTVQQAGLDAIQSLVNIASATPLLGGVANAGSNLIYDVFSKISDNQEIRKQLLRRADKVGIGKRMRTILKRVVMMPAKTPVRRALGRENIYGTDNSRNE